MPRKANPDAGDDDRDPYSGLIRLHVLHHAVEEPIFGMGMLEELAQHGYRISPGTLYPILHGLEKKVIFARLKCGTATRFGRCIELHHVVEPHS